MKGTSLVLITVMYMCSGYGQDSAWRLTGNAGTTNAHFLGTTDNRPLFFRVNNIGSGRIEPAFNSNTFFGLQAGLALTTGRFNTGTGANALMSNTTGSDNTATGVHALRYNTIGVDNTATGYQSLHLNIGGSYNTAYGVNSLQSNVSGHNNVALGHQAMFFNTTGVNNTAVGLAALFRNTTGYANVAMGYRALYSNQTGTRLVAVGDSALYSNTTGRFNTAVGSKAGYRTADGRGNSYFGFQAGYTNSEGNSNTAVGNEALYSSWVGAGNAALGNRALYNTNGSANVAVGASAMLENTGGLANTAIGQQALYGLIEGIFNTAAGSNAGNSFQGDYNTFLGDDADANADGYARSSALGQGSRITASDQVRVGRASTTSIGGFVNWSNISDKRFKKNIQQDVPGLDFILQLQPVTYNLDIKGLDSWFGVGDSAILADGKMVAASPASNQKETETISGFIAQDVEALAKKLQYKFSGVDAPKNDKDLYGLRYAEFVVPLVKAMQEQQKIIQELQQQVRELRIKLGMEPNL
jgi:hypothetical protein